MKNAIIFVYNADTGWFNTAMDIAHKMLSPGTYPCSLCALTHGVFKVRPQWEAFVQQAGIPFIFLHRDEFCAAWPALADRPLPLVLRQNEGHPETLLDATALNALNNLDELIELLRGL